MPRTLVATSVGKAGITGGAWADSLSALSGDSMQVYNYANGGARVVYAWGIDSDSVMEGRWKYTKPESTHDPNYGFRFQIPALVPGGAASVAAHNILPGELEIDVFANDTATIDITGTAADDVLLTYLTEYDDLPGASPYYLTWDQVKAMRKSTLAVYSAAVAGTPAVYGTGRALNTDDSRFQANQWYAILGMSVQTPVTTVALVGPPWGQQKLAIPGGVLGLDNTDWFVRLSIARNFACIPVFSQADAGNIFVYVADGESGTTPKIDFLMYQLSGPPF